MKVSVVIPSYNEATYIDRLLIALTKQSFKDFEVIVSDAQSKDGTAEAVHQFRKSFSLRLVQSPPKGPAAGRNAGAAVARGEWLLFLDADDDIDDPDFIKVLIQEAENRGWQTATAKIKLQGASPRERMGMYLNYHYIKLLARTKHPVAPGWCILTKRSVFESNNGFNENIQFGEDYDYVTRVGKYGFGFIEQTYSYVDLRRLHEDGFKQVLKGIGNEIYRHTHRYNLEKNPIKYEFGRHKERK